MPYFISLSFSEKPGYIIKLRLKEDNQTTKNAQSSTNLSKSFVKLLIVTGTQYFIQLLK
jgi:hypothetical protein